VTVVPEVITPRASRRHPRAAQRGRLSVAGVAGGVGATTVATAIGAADRGVFLGRPVDVLVCRATGDSLVRAARAAQLIAAAAGRKPVLAVTAADGSGPSRPMTARLRLLRRRRPSCAVRRGSLDDRDRGRDARRGCGLLVTGESAAVVEVVARPTARMSRSAWWPRDLRDPRRSPRSHRSRHGCTRPASSASSCRAGRDRVRAHPAGPSPASSIHGDLVIGVS